MAQQPLKICLATSEMTPLAKTGGLADVAAALSAYFDAPGARRAGAVAVPFGDRHLEPGRHGRCTFCRTGTCGWGGTTIRYSIDTATLPGSTVKIYLLRCPELYDRPGVYTGGPDEHLRFIALSRAAIEMCQQMGFAPDIFHCHDWHTALVPLYLKTLYAWDRLFARTRSVLTIHNIAYQGVFGADILHDMGLQDHRGSLHQEDLGHDRINFLKTGILYADLLTTVSPTYAREILGPEYGMGLQDLLRQRRDSLIGILNGVDYEEWNPRSDPLIPHTYDARATSGKKTKQAGPDAGTGPGRQRGSAADRHGHPADRPEGSRPGAAGGARLIGQRRFALAVLGSGETRYEQFFHWLQQTLRDRVCFYRGFNNRLAHWIEAGSDLFLMPSLFEPCGLNQMYSLRYGTLPIVRRTGGLADSVQLFDPDTGEGTGIVFNDYDAAGLRWAINYGLRLYQDKRTWRKLMQNGMAMDYSWEKQGQVYVDLFRQLAGR